MDKSPSWPRKTLLFLGFVTFLVTVAPLSTSHADGRLRGFIELCAGWLSGQDRFSTLAFTSELEGTYIGVPTRRWTEADIIQQIGKPLIYAMLEPSRQIFHANTVILHRLSEFSHSRQKDINYLVKMSSDPELLALARKLPNNDVSGGIEVGHYIFVFKDGSEIKSDILTTFSSSKIDSTEALLTFIKTQETKLHQLVRVEFYHTHPSPEPAGTLLSSEDVRCTSIIADHFAKRGYFPEIHMYAINIHFKTRLVSHYGIPPAYVVPLKP